MKLKPFIITLSILVLGVLFAKKKIIVLSIIAIGLFISPESSRILGHHCFGNGEPLVLNPEYIKKSPIVIANIKKLKTGESKRVAFDQRKDWRLSYALNPFIITRNKDYVVIHQYIKFDESGKGYTILDLGLFKIKVYDSIVHTFNCKPFTVFCRFKIDDIKN